MHRKAPFRVAPAVWETTRSKGLTYLESPGFSDPIGFRKGNLRCLFHLLLGVSSPALVQHRNITLFDMMSKALLRTQSSPSSMKILPARGAIHIVPLG